MFKWFLFCFVAIKHQTTSCSTTIFSLFIFIVQYNFRVIKQTRTILLLSIPTFYYFSLNITYYTLLLSDICFPFVFKIPPSLFLLLKYMRVTENRAYGWGSVILVDRMSAVCSHCSEYYSIPNTQESLIPSRFFFILVDFQKPLFVSLMAPDSLWKSDISWFGPLSSMMFWVLW